MEVVVSLNRIKLYRSKWPEANITPANFVASDFQSHFNTEELLAEHENRQAIFEDSSLPYNISNDYFRDV